MNGFVGELGPPRDVVAVCRWLRARRVARHRRNLDAAAHIAWARHLTEGHR